MFPADQARLAWDMGVAGEAVSAVFSDRSSGWLAALAGALVLAVAAMLAGCGGDDDPSATSSSKATSTTPAAAKKKTADTSDRGARRCTKTAFLAALLADVDRLPFEVSEVRCKGAFARTRFVARGCVPGQATKVPCGSAKVAAWRLGAKRWRLIAYTDKLTCTEVRRSAGDFPQTLCD
jgi:hypothetical protein